MPLLVLFFRPNEMETRIIKTKIYRDSEFRKLPDKDKLIVIYLLTNEFLEAIPIVKVGLDVLSFHCSTNEQYMTKTISNLGYFEIFYVDEYLIVGNKFTYSNYKGGKTENKREKLLSELPDNIRSLIDLEGCIDQSLTNGCSIIEHINHKSKNINHKTKNKKQKNEIENEKKLVDRFIETFNKITEKNFKPSETLEKSLNQRVGEGYTTADIVTAIKKAYEDPYLCGENESSKWYLTPEYILRKNKLDQWLHS